MSTTKKVKAASTSSTLSAKSLGSKDDYEKQKRQSKPVSFNRISEERILKIAGSFNFSVWVKNLLSALTPAEVSIIKNEKDPTFIPALLIEKAIEDGLFSIEEYLEAKGKKIVDIKETPNHQYGYSQYDETCQLPDCPDEFGQ